MDMPSRGRRVINSYRELIIVSVAAVVGLTLQAPLVWLDRHQGIEIFLVILVFSTALNIEARSLRRLPAAWRPLSLALITGIALLPVLSWLVAQLIVQGPLREGVTTIGLAPCEIASIATTAMAGGDVALAGGVLFGSTILTVVLAGPILALETTGTMLDPLHILLTLLWVVAAPLAAGITVRSGIELPEKISRYAATTSTLSVAILVALVAALVHFKLAYLAVVAAIVMFLAASTGVGLLVRRRASAPAKKALLLTMSMRDFAIAAGLAASAFGPRAAAPLGLYGITVLSWGTYSAGFMRGRTSPRTSGVEQE
jgi:predicted Na+-dependent transporter